MQNPAVAEIIHFHGSIQQRPGLELDHLAIHFPGPDRHHTLRSHRVAQALDYLADAHMVGAREDLALEECFWGQLPGNFSRRPRKAPITSRNFAGMSPFHNYAGGRAQGNHWGYDRKLVV